jgi:uncharacterized protein YfaS (alpha-2-macroglobulin family)
MPAFAGHDSAQGQVDKSLTVQRIVPTGDDVAVFGESGRQIVFEFNRSVVPLGQAGRPASQIPIEITPALACHWYWVNTSVLACLLSESDALKPATTYRIVVSPGITAEDGETIAAAVTHRFTTERPTVVYSTLRTWKGPEHPLLRVTLNQPVTKSSLESHLFLVPEAGPDTARVNLLATPDAQVNESTPFFENLKARLAKWNKPVIGPADEELSEIHGQEARRIWLVEPEAPLHGDTRYVVRLEPGLVSARGPETNLDVRDIRTLDTFPDFRFMGVECRNNNGLVIRFLPEAPDESLACDPLMPKSLLFSAPVLDSQVSGLIEFSPSLDMDAEENAWGGRTDYSMLGEGYEKGRTYSISLPSFLKAAKTYRLQSETANWFERFWQSLIGWFDDKPHEITDEFGRPLMEPIDLTFRTDHRRANYELPYRSFVLEEQTDSEVPLWVTNLERYRMDYHMLTAKGAQKDRHIEHALPQVSDVQFAVPLGAREMLDGGSGTFYGTFSTTPGVIDPWGGNGIRQTTLFGQITPYHVHVKLGHFRSLVWVTDFATGQPVSGARVSAYMDTFTELHGDLQSLADAITDAQGVAVLPGSDVLDPDLLFSRWTGPGDTQLFFRVLKEDHQALLPAVYDFQINTYRAAGAEYLSTDPQVKYGHMRSWGTTAQGIYRAGDTVDYKLYVRQDNGQQFVAPPPGKYRLDIKDPTGKKIHRVNDMKLSNFGAYHGQFTLPKDAAVGWYEFSLLGRFEKGSDGKPRRYRDIPLRVLVSDFVPAPFRVSTELNGDAFEPGQSVEVTTQASLHAGGPYSDAALRVTSLLDAIPFTSPHPALQDFTFDAGNDPYRSHEQIYQTQAEVNDKGEHVARFDLSSKHVVYGRMTVESAVQDDRGKNIAARATALYAGVNRFVGLHSPEWVLRTGEKATVHVAVVDAKGSPVGDTAADVTIEKLERKGARVKGAGNAYLTQYETQWNRFASCTLTESNQPQACHFTPDSAGSYRAIARVTDTEGRAQQSELALWASGNDFVLWDDSNTNALELMPERTELNVADTVRIMVKNPYPGAQALVTIERYGVIDHFTQTLEGSTPIIEFPVKPDYLPGFYVSVSVMAPRIGDKPVGKPGEIDLGKPAFRLGYAAMTVLDPYKRIEVTAASDQDTYRPGNKVHLDLHAKLPNGAPKEPVELAVVVIDESVFDLIAAGRSYFDPYKGFYRLGGLDLRNFNLITQLIGRQKFEKKGANPGGDGGSDLAMRSEFRFISYWNPSLPVDKHGKAHVAFDVPDNLTGWRVFAMAVTPTDRMGLGETRFTVNRPTEIRPVMPNQVMEGDQFSAGFSVMNRTDKAREITVTMQAEGSLEDAAKLNSTLLLEPFKRQTVWLPLRVGQLPPTREEQRGDIAFRIEAGDDLDRDALAHHVPVKKWQTLEIMANHGTTTQDAVTESITFPSNMRTDIGEVSLVLAPSVIGNITGAFEYLRDYPYLCWEQRLSKAIAAAQFTRLRAYLPSNMEWKGSSTLPAEALGQAANFQAPSGGMSYFLGQDEYVDPYLSAYTALGFNWLRKMGSAIPETLESSLHAYLQRFLKQDAAPGYYSNSMTSTVRAVALSALAEQGKVDLNDLNRYATHVPQMSLFGKTHFLLAALRLKAEETLIRPVVDDILSHANESAGKLTFSEHVDDGYRRLLASPLRENCAILEAMTLYSETPAGRHVAGDIPLRLVRMITQTRGSRVHWENTQENLFCMNALLTYSRVYEAQTPALNVRASLDKEALGQAVFNDLRDAPITLHHPITEADKGRAATLHVNREGEGRLYYTTRISYAPKDEVKQPVNAGMELHREYSVKRNGKWVLLSGSSKVKRGELVRVDLYLSLPTARSFVVVEDPVPGGLEPVNRDLATSSEIDADEAEYAYAEDSWYSRHSDWSPYGASRWSFYHKELRHDSARFYADYLTAGNYHLSYSAQAIAEGEFRLLPAKAEEMYDPEIFGKTPSDMLRVGGGK